MLTQLNQVSPLWRGEENSTVPDVPLWHIMHMLHASCIRFKTVSKRILRQSAFKYLHTFFHEDKSKDQAGKSYLKATGSKRDTTDRFSVRAMVDKESK